MLVAQLTLTVMLTFVAPEPVALTPASMTLYGLHIETVLYNPKTREVAGAIPAAGLVRVNVHFDPVRGPAIKSVKSTSLVVRDGERVLLSVPVRVAPYAGNRGGLWVSFRIQRDSLSNAQLLIETEKHGLVLIAPGSFIEKE